MCVYGIYMCVCVYMCVYMYYIYAYVYTPTGYPCNVDMQPSCTP